jgi:flavin reductase (DIM6/NTAB) family NADH-FMN oxidoreductase RutF
MKQILPKNITPFELQSVLQHSVAPRPIALASTVDKDGNVNVSPFSFFNMFSTNPPILIFSPLRKARGNTIKHTLENVKDVPEVVIGNVNFDMVQQVSLSSTEYEKGVNEFVKSGLTMKTADLVKPPLIAESPVNFECKVLEIKTLGTEAGAGNLVICEVLKIHIQKKFLDENGNLDQRKLNLVSRLGANWYGITSEETLFEVPKPLQNKGIGYDQLPTEIKNSKIFTGNDLGMLANIEVLPTGNFYSDENKHSEAQQFLMQSKIEEAWKVLTQ